jgi:hypothetical protein
MGRPASGCSTLASPDFIRVPLPAARTTTAMEDTFESIDSLFRLFAAEI